MFGQETFNLFHYTVVLRRYYTKLVKIKQSDHTAQTYQTLKTIQKHYDNAYTTLSISNNPILFK